MGYFIWRGGRGSEEHGPGLWRYWRAVGMRCLGKMDGAR